MKQVLMSIGSRISGGLFVIAAIILIIGGISSYHIRSLDALTSTRIMEKAEARSISKDIIIKAGYVSSLAEEYFVTAGAERKVAIRVIIADELRTLQEHLRVFADRDLNPQERAILDRLNALFAQYRAALGQALQSYDRGGRVSAETLPLIDSLRKTHEQMYTQLLTLAHTEGELMYGSWNQAKSDMQATTRFIFLMTGLAFVVAIMLGLVLTRSIKKPISELVDVLEKYGRGDYSVRTHVNSRDEIEFFAHKFNEMLDQIQAAHQQLADTIDFLPDATFVIDRDRKIVAWNRAMEVMTGMMSEEMVGKGEYAYGVPFHGKPRPVLIDLVFGDDPASERKYPSLERKGNSLYAEIASPLLLGGRDTWLWAIAAPLYDQNGELAGAIESMRDITDRKKLEEQFRQAQKMQAVGNLAGGIAHDFNNILTAIMGFTALMQLKLAPEDPLRHYVDQLLASSEKAAQLVKNLLAFSRKEVANPKPVPVNNIVRTVEKLLQRLIGEDIEFRTVIPDAELVVLADAGQIEQVLMNLVTNARDAMPNGGTLTVAIERVELDLKYFKVHETARPGGYALISVSDTGIGMDPKTRERAFEPFFTTKEAGKGTGLGLAMVYSIIKQHNGIINLYSEPGEGTTFRIYLPLVNLAAEQEASPEQPLIGGGSETILLAEDEADVRGFMASILEEFGYRVIEAADGEEAVAKFREDPGRIEYLILDVMMPKKNGREVYEEIRSLAPDLKALFLSGYPIEFLLKKGVLNPDYDFLGKPVMPQALLKKIRSALDR